jgi:hypothetical protein
VAYFFTQLGQAGETRAEVRLGILNYLHSNVLKLFKTISIATFLPMTPTITTKNNRLFIVVAFQQLR